MKKQVKKTTKKSTKNPPKKLTKKQLEALKIHDNVLLKQKKDHDADKLAEKLAIRNKVAEYWHDRFMAIHSLYDVTNEINDGIICHYKQATHLETERAFINGMFVCGLCVTLAVVILKLWS